MLKQTNNKLQEIIVDKVQERLATAQQLLKDSQFNKCIFEYTKIIFLQPENAYIYKLLAQVYVKLNDLTAAILLYKKSLTLLYSEETEEQLKQLLLLKGILMIQQGDCNDFLEGTEYDTFSIYCDTNLEAITYNTTTQSEAAK